MAIARAVVAPLMSVRAALESVGYHTRDLIEAMRADLAGSPGAGFDPDAPAASNVLRVDGGMAASDWTMQFLADILGAPVDRPANTETTAQGAAWLAGYRADLCPSPDEYAKAWQLDRRFEPQMTDKDRDRRYSAWQRAVQAVLSV